MESESWGPFWSSFVHVVRNAIDHGLEVEEDRLSAGKSANGMLDIQTRISGDTFVVSMKDDGRSIDWTNIQQKAESRGLPCSTQDDLVDALFTDGVTTAKSMSDTSGRGVGLAAIREVTESMGGKVLSRVLLERVRRLSSISRLIQVLRTQSRC
jgi:two-component system chemotaxis sensor kinase CheA